MEGLLLDTDDLDVTEEFMSGLYAKLRLSTGADGTTDARISRALMGSVSLDQLRFGYDLRYRADALGKVCLCSVDGGGVEATEPGGLIDQVGPGDVISLSRPELPHSGQIIGARYSVVMFDPELLSQVAATAPSSAAEPVRLLGHRPATPEAARRLRRTITYLRDDVMPNPEIASAALIAGAASRLLAAAVLATFPNNAVTDPSAADRRDATAVTTLRRATQFIDANAARDISLADIADAAHVGIRAVQLAFRHHYDTTPLGYLHRIRLEHVHRELAAADPTGSESTVAAIAARWGFHHPARFAARYLATYGTTPLHTLRH